MVRTSRSFVHQSHGRATLALMVSLFGLPGCGGRATTAGSGVASEAEWRALRVDRPTPLNGAIRVSVGDIDFAGPYAWPGAGISSSIGVHELVAAGLLRRRDVEFVERRRFVAIADAERNGETRRPGQPPAGVSVTPSFSIQAVWIPLSATRTSVEIRLMDVLSGEVVQSTRAMLPSEPDAVTLARSIVDGAIAMLDDEGHLTAWVDSLASEPANAEATSGVSPASLVNFLAGLAAEERWNWEGARRGYQAAAAEPAFHEAVTLLARAARLKLGGTLAEN